MACYEYKHKLTVASIIVIFTAGMLVIYIQKMGVFPALLQQASIYSSLPQPQKNISRPHILLIVADDLGFNDVGYHGSLIRTPTLDKLARSGVRLENYYVSQVCSPTRGQLLSGRHEIHTGLSWVLWPPCPYGLSLDSPTIADKLKEAGYATHMVGKWHVGYYKKEYLPTNRGFDSFFGLLNGHSDYYTRRIGYRFMQGFDLMENNRTADIAKYRGQYSTILFGDKVKNIIRNHNSDKPLFVYLPFQAPHAPMQAPKKYLKQYKILKGYRKTIAAMITCMDEVIGEVIQVMKEKGLWENTVLIFTTDNGGEKNRGASNWPLKGNKGQLFEGGIRAVGFVHSKLFDNRTTGTVSKELMHVTDWFPTLVNLAGGNLNGTKPLDGYDQWNTIKYNAKSPRKEILHTIGRDAGFHTNKFNTSLKAAVRIGDWKLVTGYKGILFGFGSKQNRSKDMETVFLFNIKKDPREKWDLSVKMPDKVQSMLHRIEHYRKGMVRVEYPKHEALANPKLHKGFWVPWR